MTLHADGHASRGHRPEQAKPPIYEINTVKRNCIEQSGIVFLNHREGVIFSKFLDLVKSVGQEHACCELSLSLVQRTEAEPVSALLSEFNRRD